MKTDLTDLEQLRQACLRAQKLIGEVASAAAEAIGEVAVTGSAGQVVGFDAEGGAVAKNLTTDMLPVVDIAHGGTGAEDAADAIAKLINPLGAVSTVAPAPSFYVPLMVYGSANKISLTELARYMLGTDLSILTSQTDYTVSRARAISLHTTLPTTLVNGCLYGIYS